MGCSSQGTNKEGWSARRYCEFLQLRYPFSAFPMSAKHKIGALSNEPVRLICQEGTSNKFWQIVVVGSCTEVLFGKIGDGGVSSTKEHKDEKTATAFSLKQIAAKLKKGYVHDTAGVTAEEPVSKKAVVSRKAPAVVKATASATASATACASDSSLPSNRLFCTEGTSNKFWQIEVVGNTTTVTYGKIGDAGMKSSKDHANDTVARTFADKQTAEKLKKGYVREQDSMVIASVGASSKKTAAPAPAPLKKGGKALPKSEPMVVVGGKKSSAGRALSLFGLCFAITGTLSVGRAEFERLITENGGKISKSVTGQTTHLVSAMSGTKKCEDAIAKGIAVVDEEMVRALITDGSGGSAGAGAGASTPSDVADTIPGTGTFEPNGAFVKELLSLAKMIIHEDDEDFDFYDQETPIEALHLVPKFESQRATEGIWESKANDELISDMNRCVDDLADNEPIDIHPGTKNVVRDLVHPSMYPLLISEGDDGNDTSKRNFWDRKHEKSGFQWLPTEFHVDKNGKAIITSHINNLDMVKYPELKSILETTFTSLLPGFEKVWSYANMLPYSLDNDKIDISDYIDVYPKRNLKTSLRNKDLQAVVKIADYTFSPGKEFEGVWHYEGMAHEDIVMTGIFYPRSDEPVTGELEFKRVFTDVEVSSIFMRVPQDRPNWLNCMIEDGFVPIGKTTTETGKLLVFPNCHAHRAMTMKNNSRNTVTRRLIVFFLINPNARITSSRDQPPMPRTISLQTAQANRLLLMQERKIAKGQLNPREIELCEH